jgi:hypothetical protein
VCAICELEMTSIRRTIRYFSSSYVPIQLKPLEKRSKLRTPSSGKRHKVDQFTTDARTLNRIRHRNGLEQDGDELHQYVVEEPERPSMPSPAGSAGSGADLSRSQSKVPKVINLDGPVAS